MVKSSGPSPRLILVEHDQMRVNLLRELSRFRAFGTLLLITSVLFLISSLGLNSRVFEKGHSVSTPKGGVIKEPDGVNGCHPAFHEPELLGLKDHGPD